MRLTLHVLINYFKLLPLCSFVLSGQRHAGMSANGDHQARTFHSAAWMYAFKPMQSRRENDRRILDTTISVTDKEMDTRHGTTTGFPPPPYAQRGRPKPREGGCLRLGRGGPALRQPPQLPVPVQCPQVARSGPMRGPGNLRHGNGLKQTHIENVRMAVYFF